MSSLYNAGFRRHPRHRLARAAAHRVAVAHQVAATHRVVAAHPHHLVAAAHPPTVHSLLDTNIQTNELLILNINNVHMYNYFFLKIMCGHMYDIHYIHVLHMYGIRIIFF